MTDVFKYLKRRELFEQQCFFVHEIIHHTKNMNEIKLSFTLFLRVFSFPFFPRNRSSSKLTRNSKLFPPRVVLEFHLSLYLRRKEKEKKRNERNMGGFWKKKDGGARYRGQGFHELTRPDENGGVRSNVTVPRDRGSPSVDLVKSDR